MSVEAAAAAAVMAQAIKASGVVVRVEPDAFLDILARTPVPLVVTATGGFFTTKFNYLTSYKGLAFYTSSPAPLDLPAAAEVVVAKKIWVPD